MIKHLAVIYEDVNGNPVRAKVTNGEYTNEIPISNTSTEKAKKLIEQMYRDCEVHISRAVKSG